MEPLFAVSSEIRRVHREPLVLLGGQRALLMQVAHPLVARAVAEHSDFPAHAVARLRRTVRSGFGIVFGTQSSARAEAERINAIHEGIHGDGYDALDPVLLAWVHATLADTAMHCFETFVGPCNREAYWRDSRRVASLFRVPDDALPHDVAAFAGYVSSTVERLVIGEDGRRLGRHILWPPIRFAPSPIFAPLRALTTFLLPEPLREPFGLHLSALDRTAVRAFARSARLACRIVPAALRTVPTARTG